MLASGNITPIDSSWPIYDVVVYSGHLLNFINYTVLKKDSCHIYWAILLIFVGLSPFVGLCRQIAPADSVGYGSNCTPHWSYQATPSHWSCYLRNIKPNFFKGKLLISGRVERLGAEDTMMPAGITTSRIPARGI